MSSIIYPNIFHFNKSMNYFPTVSIGMPVYNCGRFIKKAIDSLLKQTFSDFELIISDNCSTDDTVEICEQFEKLDKRVKFFRQKENLGSILNFNFVLSQATGKYFMWAASDDWWGSEHVMRCVNILETDPATIAAITRSEIVDGGIVNSGDFPITSNCFIIRQFLYLMNPGPNSRFYSLYRVEFVKKIEVHRYDFFAGDWAIVYDLLKYGKFKTDLNYTGFYKLSHSDAGSDSRKMIKYLQKNNKPIYFPLSDFYFSLYRSTSFIVFVFLIPVIFYQNLICLKWFLADQIKAKR